MHRAAGRSLFLVLVAAAVCVGCSGSPASEPAATTRPPAFGTLAPRPTTEPSGSVPSGCEQETTPYCAAPGGGVDPGGASGPQASPECRASMRAIDEDAYREINRRVLDGEPTESIIADHPAWQAVVDACHQRL